MPVPTPQEFAQTYNTPSYGDPWDCVEDYHRVINYTANHPNKGSSAVSSALDLPRSRIRPWMNGSRPDVVRGIQAAESRGWLAEHATPEQEQSLVELAAWALSGGSVHVGDEAHAYFTLESHTQPEFERIAATANVPYRIIREDDSRRATEARATADGSVLARILAAMGIPTEGKSTEHPNRLPKFVTTLKADNRRCFVRIYVLNRAAKHPGKDTLTIREERRDSYLDDLTDLLRRVSGERVTRSGKSITISSAAARNLPTEKQN